MPIHFFTEDPLEFKLENDEAIAAWLQSIVQDYGSELKDLNYIFCNDSKILEINKKYLQHDYFTDVITFDQSESEREIEGDIFLSVDTVRTNSEKFGTDFLDELHRVLVHGLLHLLGQNDKTEEEEKAMRIEEDKWLKKL